MSDRSDSNDTKKILLENLEEILENVLNWPFKCLSDKPLFTEKQMKFLKDAGERIEKLRKQRNVAVISGSSVGIIGGGLSIAGGIIALIPGIGTAIGLGILIPGIVISTTGSGIGTGFSVRKCISEYKKKQQVTPCLKKFVECLRDAVTAFVKIDIALDCIEDMKLGPDIQNCHLEKLLQKSQKRLEKIMTEKNNECLDVLLKIQCVKNHVEFVIEMLQEYKIAIIGTDLSDGGLAQVDKNPFERLHYSLSKLAGRTLKEKTFQTFVNAIFVEQNNFDSFNEQSPLGEITADEEDARRYLRVATGGISKTATVSTVAGSNGVVQVATKVLQCSKVACEAGKGIGNFSKAGLKSASSAATVTKFGGTVQNACKLTATAGSTTSSVTKTTKTVASAAVNIGRVTKGIAVAGIVIGALGIAIDVAFIGHAIYDILDKEKEEFPKLLDNTLEIMKNINSFLITP